MIAICEPQCKSFSHEKFNSGFIYGLRLAYPQDKLLFYADLSHIDAIKRIWKWNGIDIGDIEYIPIKFQDTGSPGAFIQYCFLFHRIFSDMAVLGLDKLFLLSFNSQNLYVIKRLKQCQKFSDIKFTLVCHGVFEAIADDRGERMSLQYVEKRSIIERIRKAGWVGLPRKVINVIKGRYDAVVAYWNDICWKWLPFKKILLWRQSADFKYILLATQAIVNVRKYIDVKNFNFYTVVLPTIFSEAVPRGRNEHVKFAVFGYGYSAMLQKVLACLSTKKLNSSYEIRIIGMDGRGTEGFPNITCPSAGRPMSREEMEKNVTDIDMFLILYDKGLYKLTCSGSLIEALSYVKPILHFDNDCINTFNKKENPIGICCDSVESMAAVMEGIINNYSGYVPKLEGYRNNMLALRKQVAIENNLQQLRDSFTW